MMLELFLKLQLFGDSKWNLISNYCDIYVKYAENENVSDRYLKNNPRNNFLQAACNSACIQNNLC